MKRGTQIIASQGKPKNNRSWPDSTPDEMGNDWSDNIRPGGTDYIGKSFEEHVGGYPVLMEGIETSDVLFDVVKSISNMFASFEDRMNTQIDAAFEESAEFDSSLGKSVLAIGHGVAEVGGRVGQLQVDDMAKSFNLGGESVQAVPQDVNFISKSGMPETGGTEGLSKEDVTLVLMKGVETGQVDALDALKFDATGELDDTVAKSLGL